MKMAGGPSTTIYKVILLIAAIIIGAGTLFYTNYLVRNLQEREREVVQVFAGGLEYIANSSSNETDFTFLFENIIQRIDFPVVLTDADNRVNFRSRSDIKNIDWDTTASQQELDARFEEIIAEMDAVNDPINVTFVVGADTLVLTKIHYGESELVKQLRYYPYVQIIIAALFILMGYIGFSQIRSTEQSNLWVGMAKETAHQFGTPLSSLMGWLELLKLNYNDPDKVQDTAYEIENDIEKLKKITNRFSKIGSQADLKESNIYDEITASINYFRLRLPQKKKSVELNIEGDENVTAKVNSDLFQWVIENLIKNALDAIEHQEGRIDITVSSVEGSVEIEVADNGKGIDMRRRKDVFRPGYSTKRRGWGLGLSLSRRIIVEYHGGRIFIKDSAPGEGTTFKIILPQ